MGQHGVDRGTIAIVRHGYYPAELNVRREAESLRAHGFAVHVVCLRGPGEAARETIAGIEVHRLPLVHKRQGILRYLIEYNLFLLLAMLRLIRLGWRHRLSAVQVNTMPDYLAFVTLPLRPFGTRTVLHVHEPMPELFGTLFPGRRHRPLIGLIGLVQRLSLAYADRALTVTTNLRDRLVERGARADKITVLVNVPDERLVEAARRPELAARAQAVREQSRRRGTVRLLCHGTIEQRYGIELIVQAIGRLKDDLPGLEFRLMGKGDHLEAVLDEARRLGVAERVAYLGFVPLDTMLVELMAADLTIVPMRANPYSQLVHTNKMFEYLAFERPVIASRLDAVVSYFPEDTLLYFAPDDPDDLARQIRHAVAHPEEMAARVERAGAIYRRHRWAEERRHYLAVYDALLGGNADGASPTVAGPAAEPGVTS